MYTNWGMHDNSKSDTRINPARTFRQSSSADWVMELTENSNDITFELVDLKEVNLPLLDEPVPAIFGKYSQPHTKAWAKIVSEADGFIIVTPEYNFSIPAALKNAL